MNKGQLKDAIAEAAGLSGADAERALDAVLDTITKTVAAGDKVTIPGFGTFERRERSARTGRNPQTGAEIQIAASKVPGFKAGAAFKAAVDSSTPPGQAVLNQWPSAGTRRSRSWSSSSTASSETGRCP